MYTTKRALIHQHLDGLSACSLKVIDCLEASLLAIPLEQYGRLLKTHSASETSFELVVAHLKNMDSALGDLAECSAPSDSDEYAALVKEAVIVLPHLSIKEGPRVLTFCARVALGSGSQKYSRILREDSSILLFVKRPS